MTTPSQSTAEAERPHVHHTHHAHRDVTGGWLRPGVFGAMDGLATNLALIAGVAGGGATPHTVVLVGLTSTAAGAFSMAVGEYTSVRTQNEAAHREIAAEKAELRWAPESERAELAAFFQRRGVDPPVAGEVARQLSRDPEMALRVHAREEFGVDVDDLPSPWLAAVSSLTAFAAGALLPLLPYLAGLSRLWVSVLVGCLGLFVTGAVVSRFTARAPLFAGARQLLLGGGAAALTYGLGHLVGAV